jgi:hypothetical protein
MTKDKIHVVMASYTLHNLSSGRPLDMRVKACFLSEEKAAKYVKQLKKKEKNASLTLHSLELK